MANTYIWANCIKVVSIPWFRFCTSNLWEGMDIFVYYPISYILYFTSNNILLRDKISIHSLLEFVGTITKALFVSEDMSWRGTISICVWCFEPYPVLFGCFFGRCSVTQLSICKGYRWLIAFFFKCRPFMNNSSLHLSMLSMYYYLLYRGQSGSDILWTSDSQWQFGALTHGDVLNKTLPLVCLKLNSS